MFQSCGQKPSLFCVVVRYAVTGVGGYLKTKKFSFLFLIHLPQFLIKLFVCIVQAARSACPHASARAQSFFVAAVKKEEKSIF